MLKTNKGFSLLELLIVLILLGILATVAAPAMGRFLDTLEFKKQTSKVMAIVRYARLMAVTKGGNVRMSLGEDENVILLQGAVEEPKDFDLSEDGSLSLDPDVIIFFPQGYATPGSLILISNDRQQAITIDPLSGLPLLDFDEDE